MRGGDFYYGLGFGFRGDDWGKGAPLVLFSPSLEFGSFAAMKKVGQGCRV